jgi:hypothetical protein
MLDTLFTKNQFVDMEVFALIVKKVSILNQELESPCKELSSSERLFTTGRK